MMGWEESHDSLNAEKASDKIIYYFLRILNKFRWKLLCIIKAICEKSITNFMMKAFPLRAEVRQGRSLLPFLVNIVLDIPAIAI